MDSTTSSSSLRRWQKALAASCQAVSSVATVRLTWTQTWLLPKLPAKGRLPKLVQLATPATGCWMLVEEWRMCFSDGNDSELNRKFREKPRKIWLGIVGVLADIRAATSRLHSPQPPANSQSAATSHIRTSVRSLSLTVGSQTLYHWAGNERRNVRTNGLERRSSGSNVQRWAQKITILHA